MSDAIAIIVSEERKIISVAEDGELTFYESISELKERLVKSMGKTSVVGSMKNIFEETETEEYKESKSKQDISSEEKKNEDKQ